MARKRDDLVVVEIRHRHESAVVVKDPLAMKYVRLRDDEYFVLSLLDGHRTLEQICEQYAAKFFPRSVKPAQLNALLFRFHEHGLLVSSPVGQAVTLAGRAQRKRREKIQQALLSPIFIRFPGVDPDRFLSRTIGFVRVLLHPLALALYAVMAMTALVLLSSRFEQFVAETTDMNRWFHFESMAMLMCVIGGTKILHELGHAYACKHFGGECHTIGPMLLLFSPALYCDTTDSWLLPNRWHRAAVGAAGIGVELVLASIATFVWIMTPAGLIHYGAMNVMLVCSVSTLLFNANPLLRYDGYYILSDLCDVPNLAQRSQRMLTSTLTRLFLTGGESQETMENPGRTAMVVYAAMAWVYRWSLTFAILFLLSRLLEPIGLRSVGLALCFVVASTALYGILKPMIRFFTQPMKRRKLEMRRIMLTSIAALMLIALVSYPLPSRVSAVATLTPKSSQAIYASSAGFIEFIASPGQRVEQGELIVRLRNPAIELDYVSAKGKRDNQQALVDALRSAELHDPTVSHRLPAAIATLDDLTTQFIMHRGRRESLEIRAGKAGRVLPGERKSSNQEDDEEQLSGWTDYPTDKKNHGCFVANGTELMRIADEETFEAELLLPQSVAQRVMTDAPVKLSLVAMPGDFQQGQVVDVSRRSMSVLEGDVDGTEAKSALAAGTTGLDVSYLVKVQLPQAHSAMRPGQQGDALISTAPMSIAQRIYLSVTGLLRMR